MAEVAGLLREVFILAGSTAMTGSTGAKINGVDNSTFNRLCELLEITQSGDAYRKRMAGVKDTNLTLSGNYDPADTNGQLELEPGDSIYIGVYPQGSSVAGTQIPALVESVEQSAEASGKQTFSATVQGNGAPETLPAQV